MPSPGQAVVDKRIAIVVTQLGWGGAETQTMALLRSIRGTEWAPTLVVSLSPATEPYGRQIEEMGYRLAVLPRRSSYDLQRVLELRRMLRRDAIDLVHAVGLLASGYSWLAAMGRSTRVLPGVRGTVVSAGPLRTYLYRRMFAGSPVALANSMRGAEFVSTHFGATRQRVIVVANGVDFEALRKSASEGDVRRERGIPNGAPVIAFVGKDSAVKNVPAFMRILRQIVNDSAGPHALIIGHGLDETARTRLAPDLPAQFVHFLGPRADVPALLAQADVLVSTSNSEGCPNVVLEALGVGTPVVAPDVGDIGTMLPDRSTLVPSADTADYVGVIKAVLADLPAVRTRVRTHWPTLERRFGLQRCVEETLNVWSSALNLSPPLKAPGGWRVPTSD